MMCSQIATTANAKMRKKLPKYLFFSAEAKMMTFPLALGRYRDWHTYFSLQG